MGGVRSSASSGAAVLATSAPCLPRAPHVLRGPEYRLVLRVGSVATPRVIMPAVCPWRQGTPCGELITSVKLAQPERLHHQGLGNQLLAPEGEVACQTGHVVRRDRLGGLLSYYHRE